MRENDLDLSGKRKGRREGAQKSEGTMAHRKTQETDRVRIVTDCCIYRVIVLHAGL